MILDVSNQLHRCFQIGCNYEAADVLLARILKERREKWNGKGKYKEAAAPDITDLPMLSEDGDGLA